MEEPHEADSFDAFMRARSAGLLRYGYALTGNRHDAADLVQEALVRVGSVWAGVRRKGDPERYIRTTMARLHVSWWRRRRRERLVGSVPDRPYEDSALAQAETRGGVLAALAKLPPRQRAVLVLRYYERYSDEEIAAALAISRGTVRSQAARALDKLRKDWMPPVDRDQPQTLTRRQQ